MKNLVDMIYKKASAASTLREGYKSLVQPYFEYCSPLWGAYGKSGNPEPEPETETETGTEPESDK